MALNIILLKYKKPLEDDIENALVLRTDTWNDFCYQTFFHLSYVNDLKEEQEIGEVKIGFFGQTTEKTTIQYLNNTPRGIFSVGQDDSYYKKMYELPIPIKNEILSKLGDVVANPELLNKVEKEDVYIKSLVRFVSRSLISNQYKNILKGYATQTPYSFEYRRKPTEKNHLTFHVRPDSTPPTNIHVLIGRNGAGKTTVLREMAENLKLTGSEKNKFFTSKGIPIDKDYFSKIILSSFSIFDLNDSAFKDEQNNPRFQFIGSNSGIKNVFESLSDDFVNAIEPCIKLPNISERYIKALSFLKDDDNLCEIIEKLENLIEKKQEFDYKKEFEALSSGHAIALSTITQLVAYVHDKTIVFMDEPESHLHPPLLSALIRAISDLLTKRNGLAIIATHSPVVLQEVPKSCVWYLERTPISYQVGRLNFETYAENLGTLTREVFGLEVRQTGFHKALKLAAEKGKTFDSIMANHENNIGLEGQALLSSFLHTKNKAK